MADIPQDDRIGREIAAANKAATAREVALVIIKTLFENGPNRLPADAKYVAAMTIAGALETWRAQLLAEKGNAELEKWKEGYREVKAELDNLKLHLAVMQKEGKLG